VSDPTLAASWGLYDLVAGDWNAAFLERLDLPAWLLPPILGSGDELGGLVSHVAWQVGLPAAIPVFNPIGDVQAAFLGSVAEPETTVLFNLGTGGQICWMVPHFESPSERVETRPLLGRRHLRVGASLCGGAAYAWLNRTVRSWLSEFGVERDEQTVYARLNALASACERPEPLRVRPTFLGVRGDPGIQWGAIEGIALDGIELGALARATFIGIVDELRDLYAAHASRMEKYRQVVGTGGGVQNNRLLPTLIEDRFGLAVHVPCHQETAAVGAALLPRFIRDASE
jgi:sedoheptulokinase